eukprot:scaffold8904_cov42-Prasinocladus_malaysianus.AAC.1
MQQLSTFSLSLPSSMDWRPGDVSGQQRREQDLWRGPPHPRGRLHRHPTHPRALCAVRQPQSWKAIVGLKYCWAYRGHLSVASRVSTVQAFRDVHISGISQGLTTWLD